MTQMEANDWNQILVGECLTLDLIGKAFYHYPEKVWLQSLIDADPFAEAPFANNQPDVFTALKMLQTWVAENRPGLSDGAFEDIRVDYTRLFMGRGFVIAPPWESVCFSEERLTFQEQTLQVRDWYQRFELRAENLHREPDDHIGLELEFLAHLARRGVARMEQNDKAGASTFLNAQRDFLAEHTIKWAPKWCDLVEKEARTTFYRGMARLGIGVISEMASILDVRPLRAQSA
jgi:putative dimethyl sulfoxide reductase chaperone